ncbi:MAG: DUF5679 domain-containing protein [Anaerolineae bacterium]
MGKSWRWMALGALIGMALGWILLRRRLARQPQLADGPRRDEEPEGRIVLPMSRAAPSDPGTAGGQGNVKGEITLPGGVTLTTDESESFAEAAPDASAAPEDDRIELPLHAATGRPMVGDMNGADQSGNEEGLASEAGDEAQVESEAPPALEGGGAILGGKVEAYCVRCKTQRPMVRVTQYVTSKNRAALKGECAVCGAGMFKFIKE